MTEKVNYWLTPEGLAERAKEFARFLTVRTFNGALQMFAVEGGLRGFLYRTDLYYGHVCSICSPYEAKFYRAGQFMKSLPQHPWCRCWYDILVMENIPGVV